MKVLCLIVIIHLYLRECLVCLDYKIVTEAVQVQALNCICLCFRESKMLILR
jgi:hypothetical protein